MAYYGPGSGNAPAGYTPQYTRSAFLDPSAYDTAIARNSRVANVAGVGMFTLGSDPNDPLTRMLGRLPGEAPNYQFGNQYLQSLDPNYYGGGGGGAPMPAGMDPSYFSVHNPNSSIYQGPSGIGQTAMTGPMVNQQQGAGSFGPVQPGQLSSLFGPSQGEQRALQASQMAFQEFERMPGLYQNQLAQNVGGAIDRQMSGQDAPFTPETIDQMRARIGSQAGSADAARQRMISDQAGGRGLGGGGMELGLRLASQEQGAKQRAMEGNQLDITSQLENFASRERGRQAGQGFLQEQLSALQPAALGKANVLANYENFGDPMAGLRGLFTPQPPQSGPGYNPMTGGFSVSSMGSPFSVLGNAQRTGVQGFTPPPTQQQQQSDYLQKAMAFLGLGGGGMATQATQATQATPLIGTPGAPNPYSGTYYNNAPPPNPYGYY
ncbi:MAG: hypothetical protein JSV86_04855 [Gemmatimonadota bacterium]|nr:MAG: hypothetical protein JSV86_04855 [Gemmatimonadota bacterium]